MAKLADTLRSLDVPVSIIADIDILNDERTFRNLFENLGGNWDEAKLHWKAISDHVVNQRHRAVPSKSLTSLQGNLRVLQD